MAAPPDPLAELASLMKFMAAAIDAGVYDETTGEFSLPPAVVSLSGSGLVASPGDLLQAGGFKIVSGSAVGFQVDVSSGPGPIVLKGGSIASIAILGGGGTVTLSDPVLAQIDAQGTGKVAVAKSGDTLSVFGAGGAKQILASSLSDASSIIVALQAYGVFG